MNPSRILVPIDFSAGSLRALDYAVGLSETLGGEIEALLVVEAIHLSNPASILGPGKTLRNLVDEQCRAAEADLVELERDYAGRGTTVRTRLEIGSPADTICTVATKDRADLIVMATHGRTGLSHLILGSVAEHVLRAAPCPVLTVHTYDSRKARTRRRQG